MAETFELTRSPDDRRVYTLGDLGSLRLEGLFSRAAVARANDQTARFSRRGVFTTRSEARDEAGTLIGSFQPRTLRRGGTVEWSGAEFALRPASAWRERYALADGEHELALFEGKGWGRRPVRVEIDDSRTAEPMLLLFAAFVVRGLAEDAGGAAAAASASTAATG
jgi:hypothetical protein